MAYSTREDLIAQVSENNIIPFVDDDADGQPDYSKLDRIIDVADASINGRLASIYTVPISPTIPLLRYASIIFSCEILYRRRMVPEEKNPFGTEADALREQLTKIGNGELPLDLTIPREFTQGVAITRSTIYGARGTNCPSNTM